MSVYTPLALDDIRPWLAPYGLPPAMALLPIRGGIENSNFFLSLADGREYVLTVFEALSADEAAFLAPLLEHAARAGLPVAAPLRTSDGAWLRPLAGKPAQLAPRLPGRHAEAPDAAQCQAVGAALAALHRALATHSLARVNAHGRDWWQALAAHWQPRLPADEQALLAALLKAHDIALARAPALPAGLIHGDLFRDNLLFTGTMVSGLLDFSECGHDHWLLDIAIAMNDFCRAWPADTPDPAREKAFLAGYASVRPLTADEQQALPAFLAVAAMRFWLSRLDIAACNARAGRGGEHVTEKDPAEMRWLAARRLAAIPA